MKNSMLPLCRPAYGIFTCTALLYLFFAGGTLSAQQHFITTWKTDNPGTSNSTSITIPTSGTGYNYQVDWDNDGVFDQSGITGNVTHNFGTAGTYTIRIGGTFPKIYFNSGGDRLKLIDIVQWGSSIAWTSMIASFRGCANLNISATDAPNLSGVTSLKLMFASCTTLNSPANIGTWNTATINDISDMFSGATSFNQPIGAWNTAAVITMSNMFNGATSFNQPIGAWNTTALTNMTRMFENATSFDQPIGTWNTSSVTNMSYVFNGAAAFDQPLANWNTASVTNMSNMFRDAVSFNQPIGNWSTSSVINMNNMFNNAASFNQPIGSWNTASVTDMSNMFTNADVFNQPIGTWNTAAVTDMGGMFSGAAVFNQDISTWNTAAVTDMSAMFTSAALFNQPISTWNTGAVTDMSLMFQNADQFNQPIGTWNTASVTATVQMFYQNSRFNQPLNNWNMAAVTNMNYMFAEASSFNQSLANWTLNPNVLMNIMLSYSGMSCTNYSATLIGWAANPSTPSGRSLGCIGRSYGTSAVAARTYLDVDKAWTFTGDVASGASCALVLPVEWVRFSGHLQDNSIVLDWETAREQHNLGFQVERSLDGATWEALAFVPARNAASENQRYTYIDQDAARACSSACTLYYRLRQLDADGGEGLSKIVSVPIGGLSGQPGIRVFPNPVQNGALTLVLPETAGGVVTVRLLNSTGQTLRSATLESGTHVWDVHDLPAGIYTLSGWGEGSTFSEKIIVKG
ncbi:MAG: BspA family leucine-rich repeat surface protein [Saprospiraceae bacterium]|nr:BspA family leucine-rich repeat surface protein [Saprospiraceae bacterium]